jgi:predicted metal-dependent hydrolase
VPENHFQSGLALFNSARFFEAHEALEEAWRAAPRSGPLRRRLQGMVQLAVAFHHESTGNYIGARSVLKRSLRNLEGAEESFPELDFLSLRATVNNWERRLDKLLRVDELGARASLPEKRAKLPQIKVREKPSRRA